MTKFLFFIISILFSTAVTAENIIQESIIETPLPARQYIINGDIEGDFKLLIFLHGQGQRGTDNTAQIAMGKDELIDYCTANKIKIVAIFPQCPESDRWMTLQKQQGSILPSVKPSPSLLEVLDITEAKAEEFDAAEIYITGFSMGGFGTWLAAGFRPDLFDAALPLCGGGDLEAIGNLATVPIFAVHGSADDVVPVFCSRLMVNAIRKAGGEKIIYREIPGIGHDCWTETYSSPETWDWLFSQKKDR